MINYKFSIITPEHKKDNIPFLMELFDTIKSQTYDNWEWILYLNGDCKPGHLPQELKDHPQVKFYTGITNPNVGFIKNKAFSLGQGDILVEVDHDDLLSEDCLEELNTAFQDEEVGFAYSEDLLYDMRGDEHKIPWNPDNGWTYKWMNFRGEDFIKIDAFPPTSHSIGIIWYAPDHVRAWRKSVYQELGGHNPELNICDDHELVAPVVLYCPFAFHCSKFLVGSLLAALCSSALSACSVLFVLAGLAVSSLCLCCWVACFSVSSAVAVAVALLLCCPFCALCSVCCSCSCSCSC